MKNNRITAVAFAVLFAGAGTLAAQDVKLKEEKPGLRDKAKVSYEAAMATAQARVPKAKLAAAELEEEGGKLIYSFDFKTAGKSGIDEVNVDAVTGAFVKMEHETAAAEAKEAKADARTKAKATKKP